MQYTDRHPWQCILNPVRISSVTEPYIQPTWYSTIILDDMWVIKVQLAYGRLKQFKSLALTYFLAPFCLIFITTADNLNGLSQQ
jgi:hypothetical protein